jgi:prolyl-tRNA editing enzyme YbaK/EbsC (Cys-tRNA(Pro) deacylase)
MAKPSGLERFQAATSHLNLDVRQMSQSTHTAPEAAAAVGAPVEAIVKSLLFMAEGKPLLVLASGPNRVNPQALGVRLGVSLEQADAKAVKVHTGWSIGGVPPFGHPTALPTVMDENFVHLEMLWAAAGSAQSVFPITPQRLQDITLAKIVSVV